MVKIFLAKVKGNDPIPLEPPMSQQEAEEHTLKINETAKLLAELLRQANTRQVHKAMGYDSFGRYSIKEVSQVIKKFF